MYGSVRLLSENKNTCQVQLDRLLKSLQEINMGSTYPISGNYMFYFVKQTTFYQKIILNCSKRFIKTEHL